MGKSLSSKFFCKAMLPLMQELLETEVKEFLEREHYERRNGRPLKGYRNSYEPSKIKTAEGKVEIKVPQVRDTT